MACKTQMTRIVACMLIATILLTSTKWSYAADCEGSRIIKLGQEAPCDGHLVGDYALKKLLISAEQADALKVDVDFYKAELQNYKLLLSLKTAPVVIPWYKSDAAIVIYTVSALVLGGFAGYEIGKHIK